jgi:predicted nucleic acid-binding protein
LRAQLVIDVRVVNDFAGEVHVPIGETLARLIGVVDGAIDAVTEAELLREMNREAAGVEAVAVRLDAGDERTVIAGRQHVGHLVLEVEPFTEDQWRHACAVLIRRPRRPE